VMDEGVDEGAVGIAGRGVDHQPRWFIDDDERRILKNYLELNCLGTRDWISRWWYGDDDHLTWFDPSGGGV